MTEKETLIKKAKELSEKKKYKETVELLTDALLEKHNNSSLYFSRAYAYHELKEYDKAIIDYSNDIKLRKAANSFYNRGILWKEKGEHDKAIADYNEAIKLKKK